MTRRTPRCCGRATITWWRSTRSTHVCTQDRRTPAPSTWGARLGPSGGNVVRHNFFHDLGIFGYGRHGVRAVYLDDCASGTTIYGNVFLCCTRAVLIGGGRDNRVQNNLFVHCEPAIQLDGRGQCLTEQWRGHGPTNTMRRRLEELDHQPPLRRATPPLAELDAVYEAGGGFEPTGNVISQQPLLRRTLVAHAARRRPALAARRRQPDRSRPRFRRRAQ